MKNELIALLKDAVLADETPAILRTVKETCEAHKEVLLAQWKSQGYPGNSSADDNYVCPLWIWWGLFGDQLDFIIEASERRIEERPMTRKQLDEKRNKAALERKREELKRLQQELAIGTDSPLAKNV